EPEGPLLQERIHPVERLQDRVGPLGLEASGAEPEEGLRRAGDDHRQEPERGQGHLAARDARVELLEQLHSDVLVIAGPLAVAGASGAPRTGARVPDSARRTRAFLGTGGGGDPPGASTGSPRNASIEA